MRSDLSLGDLKNQKVEKFYKKRAVIDFEFFFDIEAPYETRTRHFYRLSSARNTKLVHFLARNLSLKYFFNRKYVNLKKNHTKSEQISHVHTKLQSSITPRKKTKTKKSF